MQTESDPVLKSEHIEESTNFRMELKKKRIKLALLAMIVLLATIITALYVYFGDLMLQALKEKDFIPDQSFNIEFTIVMVIRIIMLSLMSACLYNSWLKTPNIYLGDAKFLFGTFFFILTIGKFVDLFYSLTYFYFEEAFILTILKVRYLIIVLTLSQMLYFGIYILLFSLHDKHPQFGKREYLNQTRNAITLLIISIMTMVILLAPTVTFISMTLPIFVIPSLATIVYVFYIANKQGILSEVRPKIIMMGFLIYFITNILRPILQIFLGRNSLFAFVTELADLIVFSILFYGFIKRK